MKNEKETMSSLRSEGALRREQEHKRRVKKIIPLLIFVAIAVFIARQEIPVFSSWVDRLLDADGWAAAEACRKDSLQATGLPGFARLLNHGRVQATADGYFVSNVEYAVMETDGKEREYSFSCNVSRAGKVVSMNAGQFTPNVILAPK
jgi:hypothetical protein